MDSLVSAALEEICARGAGGVPIPELWPALHAAFASSGLPASDAVKRILWGRLLALPGLRFSDRGGAPPGSHNPTAVPLEEAERSGLIIVAEERLRDNFVGLYDRHASTEIPPIQRRALERLAAARTKGVTQRELAKEFGIKGNNVFYIVRNLEYQQLIVRQSTILRAAKELGIEGENEIENTSIVNTNLIHLRRYAKDANSNSQQRIEITRTDLLEGIDCTNGTSPVGSGTSRECVKEVVCVKDFLPAMKAICDKLEEATGKVLVVSDIKVGLGYTNRSGHRAWRNILNRLKEASLVEEFEGKTNDRVVNCLRLLKKFDPRAFQPKTTTCGYDGFDSEQIAKHGKSGQITDQFFELPIDHRIYDMVDAEGVRGITFPELCGRLGLSAKKMNRRLTDMCSRYGMHMQSELQNRTAVYRMWTSENYQRHLSNKFPEKSEVRLVTDELSTKSSDLIPYDQSGRHIQMLHPANDISQSSIINIGQTRLGVPNTHSRNIEKGDAQITPPGTTPQNLMEVANVGDPELDSATRVTEADTLSLEGALSVSATLSKNDSLQSCQRFTSPVLNTLREQRILTRLENEKLILVADLHRWLEGLEKDKPTMMARKTLNRTLNKIQQEGFCKLIQVSIPGVTNFSRTRAGTVILHPSVGTLTSELLEQIYNKQRQFDILSRGGCARSKNDQSATELTGVEQSSSRVGEKPEFYENKRANGFVPARMVRVKLLHNFLWRYLSNLPDRYKSLNNEEHGPVSKNSRSEHHLFALSTAIKAMPLELFLQVVGSSKVIEGMVEHCKLGHRLLDLPTQEYKGLMDTCATGRLSSIIQVLVRLKLIQLVGEGLPEDVNMLPHAVVTHAMELRPFIEEPFPGAISSPNANASDFLPRVRHDFVLSKQEAVDAYWQTLEYCYAAADPAVASHAFPGSAVHEVFLSRSWTSVRVMTTEQRMELFKHVGDDRSKRKLLFQECVKIAKDLRLTVEQVLRVYYGARRSRIRTYYRSSERKERENHTVRKKRKRGSLKNIQVDTVNRESSGPIMSSSDVYQQCVGISSNSPASNENHDSHLQACNDDNFVDPEVHSDLPEEPGDNTFISRCAFPSPKLKRQKKFPWTDNLDRQLVIQYARFRATMGARFHRVDWTSLSDLPAIPHVCRRRMALFNRNAQIRKAVMNLCNLLGIRYARYLSETCRIHGKKLPCCHDSGQSVQDVNSKGIFVRNLLATEETTSTSNSQFFWDDFEQPDIKTAVDEILRYKRMAKLGYPKRVASKDDKEWPDITPTEGTNSEAGEYITPLEQDEVPTGPEVGTPRHVKRRRRDTKNTPRTGRSKSRSQQTHREFLKLLNRRGGGIRRPVSRSLAVANAIELLKLVFLSTSSAPDVQAKLATLLKLYSEYDLFEAFNYLREKGFMDVGHGSRPYVLSRKFWQNAASSPFPNDSGKRAANFSSWLLSQEMELMTDGVSLTSNLQCGEVFHLLALVSMEKIFVTPCLPKDGVGEADELMSSKSGLPMEYLTDVDEPKSLKRKCENGKMGSEKEKKQKPQAKIDSDFCSRREKGFPGIKVILNCEGTVIRDNAIQCTTIEKNANGSLSYELKTQVNSSSSVEASLASNLNTCKFYASNQIPDFKNESPCDAMVSYATILSSRSVGMNEVINFSPEVFKSVYSAIHQAGEQGLSMEEISGVMDLRGMNNTNIVVDTLEAFQLAIKVNSYDSIRIVDSSYRSKYFISTDAENSRDHELTTYLKSRVTSYLSSQHLLLEKTRHLLLDKTDNILSSTNVTSVNLSDGHKVTILNLPRESAPTQVKMQPVTSEASFQSEVASIQGNHVGEGTSTASGVHVSRPILPWINGDGSMNTDVYKGLRRRLLGIVMQNPGVLEEDIIRRMDVLNPQSCRELMDSMVTDKHISVRIMKQTTVAAPPALFRSIIRPELKKQDPGFRKHYFANPMSTCLL